MEASFIVSQRDAIDNVLDHATCPGQTVLVPLTRDAEELAQIGGVVSPLLNVNRFDIKRHDRLC